MFTGIIESMGIINDIQKEGSNLHFTVQSPISNQLKIDQSIAHNGVCLTVVAMDDVSHTVTAIDETLQKTNLGDWQKGTKVNLERCMVANGRYDGHIVQGHVDTVTTCVQRTDADGSTIFQFALSKSAQQLVIEKGSICINGISLTCFNVTDDSFEVAIIPYTIEHTNLGSVEVNSKVNIEFDVLGKYVAKMLQHRV